MDIKQYSREVLELLDNLTDDEFDSLLLDAGLDKCPFENTETSLDLNLIFSMANLESGVYKKSALYAVRNKDTGSFVIS